MPDMPASIRPDRPLTQPDLQAISLAGGKHGRRENGVCAAEALAWMAGESHSDTPQSVCPAVLDLIRTWNDQLSQSDRDRLLRPLLPILLNTNHGPGATRQNRERARNHLLQVTTPLWLTAGAGGKHHADLLRDIPSPTDSPAQAQEVLQQALQDILDSQQDREPPDPLAPHIAHHAGASGLRAIIRTARMGETTPTPISTLVSLAQALSLRSSAVALQEATLPPDPQEHNARALVHQHQQDTLHLLRQMANLNPQPSPADPDLSPEDKTPPPQG